MPMNDECCTCTCAHLLKTSFFPRQKGRPHYHSAKTAEYAQIYFDLDAGELSASLIVNILSPLILMIHRFFLPLQLEHETAICLYNRHMALQLSLSWSSTVAGRHLGRHHQLTEPIEPVQSSSTARLTAQEI